MVISALFLFFQSHLNQSRKRVAISSLYLGTGEKERRLVQLLGEKLNENRDLRATVLLDYTRGTRLDSKLNSSKTLLLPLVQQQQQPKQSKRTDSIDEQKSKLTIGFFLSPLFSWFPLKRWLLPQAKYNEIVSLQHMKCYLFDDDVIISGANLNDQYFTNRQDRYVCIHSPALADYLEQLVVSLGDISQRLLPDGRFECKVDILNRNACLDILSKTKQRLSSINNSNQSISNDRPLIDNNLVHIVPLMQMRCFDIIQDEQFTATLFDQLPVDSQVRLTSGYFNLTEKYIDLLTKDKHRENNCRLEIVMASEQVNSFYKAGGLLSHIPPVYTQLAKNFLKRIRSRNLSEIRLKSYLRNGWTYHAKGLWLKQQACGQMLVMIGSPNFGYRSVYRDLELQCAFFTRNADLQQQFEEEYRNIVEHTHDVDRLDQLPDVKMWIRIILPLIKRFF